MCCCTDSARWLVVCLSQSAGRSSRLISSASVLSLTCTSASINFCQLAVGFLASQILNISSQHADTSFIPAVFVSNSSSSPNNSAATSLHLEPILYLTCLLKCFSLGRSSATVRQCVNKLRDETIPTLTYSIGEYRGTGSYLSPSSY